MAVKIRLARGGAKKKPFYRVVAADVRARRDGRFLEKLGTYAPGAKDLKLNKERVQFWLDNGAMTSETVNRLLIAEGFKIERVEFLAKPAAAKEA